MSDKWLQIKRVRELADSGNHADAESGARELLASYPGDLNVEVNCGSILLDCARVKSSIKMVEEAIVLLERHRHTFIRNPLAHYQLATAYVERFNLSNREGSFLPEDQDMILADRSFRLALCGDEATPEQRARILVNYGNLLSVIGRAFDAIHLLEQALELAPQHPLALFNRAVALRSHTRLEASREKLWLELAEADLESAKQADAKLIPSYLQFIKRLESELVVIRKRLAELGSTRPTAMKEPLASQGVEQPHPLDALFKENDLYLTLSLDPRIGRRALQDMAFPRIIQGKSRHRDPKLCQLADHLNDLKERYGAARLLLGLSVFKHEILEVGDKGLAFVDTGRDAKFGIRSGLLKSSYRMSFDILDSIAFFLNDYLSLGLSARQVSFTNPNLWQSRGSSGTWEPRPEIVADKTLWPLYHIFLEVSTSLRDDGEKGELKHLRDVLTHRYLVLHDPFVPNWPESEREYHTELNHFFGVTAGLLRLVKHAILYLFVAVDAREAKAPKQ